MLSSIDQNLLPPPDPSSTHVLPSQFSNSSSPSPSSTSSSPSSKPSLPQLQQPVPSPEVEFEADLPNPLPSFSIRDYVFTARSKDIKANWPFALKNLQLCLNHGLTEVLPPFQPLGTKRNLHTFGRSRMVKEPPITTIVDKVNTSKFDNKKNDGLLEPSSDDTDTVVKLTEKQVDTISSCRHVEEDGNSFPSLTTTTTTSVVESLPKASLRASKKCRLVVKFGDRGVSGEDIASTSTTVTPIVSESSSMMASKVCPVCRTFSSSSNTTLNAHIDQCLAVESSLAPPKWTADDDDDHSKVAKHHHRVKPRRTRLMVDIYKTAPRCTLEELDRRNGRLSSLAMEEIDEDKTTCLEGKREKVKSVQAEKNLGDVGPVYIDESGTKVRILSSKFDEVSPVVAGGVGENGVGMKKKKCLRGSKNTVAMKKRKSLVHKHKKYLKLAAQSKKLFSDKMTRSSQVHGNHEQPANLRTFSDKELHASQQQIMHGNNSGNLRPWVCSKPRGIPKKINNHHQEGHQQPPVRSQWHSPRVESDDQSFPGGDSSQENTGIQKFTNLSENLSFHHERIEKNKSQEEVSIKRKRGRPLSRRPVITGDEDVGKSFSPMKQKFVESNRDGHCDRSLKPLNVCKNKMTESLDKVSSDHSVVEARKKKIKKWSNFKEPPVHLINKRRDVLLAGNYEVDQEHDLMHDHREYQVESDAVTEELACGDSNAMTESRQIEGMLICNNLRGKEGLGLNSLDSLSPGFGSTRELDHGNDIAIESMSKTTDGMHSGASLSKSIDTVFYSVKNASKLSMEDYRGFLSGSEAPTDSAEPDFVNEHEMATELDTEFDSEEAENRGMDSFPEVDPIPIPGPPGSFLPSPRDMGGSDDLQGNSSVTTTSRAQSSLDLGNVVDKDSSESPISAASSISNSTTTAHNGCGLDFVESKRSLASTAVTSSDIEPLVQNGDGLPVNKSCIEKELNMRLDRNHLDKGSFTVRNDDHHQPCCCQRKGRIPLAPASIVLNQHDSSLLLRRRKMAAASMTADHPSDKPKGCSSSMIPRSSSTFDTRTEYAPPSSCPTSGADNVGFHVIKPHVIPSMDYESSIPSTPNPVLRLMGKNLMVVNKEDEAPKPPYLQQQQLTLSSHSQTHYAGDPQFPTFATIGNVRNHEPRSWHQMVPPHPHSLVVFPSNLHGHHVSPYSNVGLANAAAVHLPNGMFRNCPPQCNPLATNAYSSPSPRCTREVIIIDDDPERAHPMMANKFITKYGEGSSIRENNNNVIPSGSMYLPGGMQSNYSPNHMRPIACYPPFQEHHHAPPIGESSQIICGNRFHSTTSSNIRWPAVSSGMMHQSPLQAAAAPPPPPSSNGLLRSSSALYYSPSFS